MKQFHISNILSITTGKLVSTTGMDGIYEILNFMTGDSIFTHQIPRAIKECKPHLLEQFPQLKEVTAEKVTGHNWEIWLENQIDKYGMFFDVKPLSEGEYKYFDPIAEVVEMINSKE